VVWIRTDLICRLGLLAVACVPLAPAALAQQAPAAPAEGIAPGTLTPRVACAKAPDQTYALYLPSNFSRDRIWPVVLALDPAARGSVPVELMKDAAEKYGYIVVGSNNSRNGPFTPSYAAAAAVAEDVSRRFPVDGKRVYLTGFSGGARAAVVVAKLCQGCAAGVILHGAGFPSDPNYRPDKNVSFAVFSAIGMLDFNYSEVIPLQEEFDALGITRRLRRFAGPHNWAPPEVWMEAFEWLDLVAMKRGVLQRNDAFIVQQLAARMARAREREAAGDLYAAWQELRDITRDFAGLADTSDAAARVTALERDPRLQQQRDAERKGIEEEKRILLAFDRAFTRMLNLPAERMEARAAVESEVESLRRRRDREKENAAASPVVERSFTQVSARLYEAGDHARHEKDFPLAVLEFELWAKLIPTQPFPHYHLARTYSAAGKKKDALKALRKAVELGFNRPDALAHDDFASLQSDPEFQKLLAAAKAKAEAATP
jgi:dienelactone hydrolase